MAPRGEEPERRREPRIRSGPTLGGADSRKNISVPISIGLPLLVVGGFLLLTASSSGSTLFWVLGGVGVVLGLTLFASGRTL